MPDGRRAPKTLARHLDISVDELAGGGDSRRAAKSMAPTRPIVHFEGSRRLRVFRCAGHFAESTSC